MTVLQYLISLHTFGAGRFWSKEKPKEPASNSELRRWIAKGSFAINGEPCTDPNEVIDFPLHSVILFPKNPLKRITLL